MWQQHIAKNYEHTVLSSVHSFSVNVHIRHTSEEKCELCDFDCGTDVGTVPEGLV